MRQNPIGLPIKAGQEILLVYIGDGEHTHVYHPGKHRALCNSGRNAGRKKADGTDNRGKAQEMYKSSAKFITCYRCAKLAAMNLNENRKAWDGP
ncbi:MAG: hypothetical protein Q8P12_01350 [bacterium]|nr:hypothetical protein [bacterium]